MLLSKLTYHGVPILPVAFYGIQRNHLWKTVPLRHIQHSGQVASRRQLSTKVTVTTRTTSDKVMSLLDYSGTASFALTGSIAALTSGMDVLGCTIIGSITALGGGTIRDAIIGRTAFWMLETEYLWISIVAASTGFWGWKEWVEKGDEDRRKDAEKVMDGFGMMLWDALGVGAFAVIGAKSGCRAGLSPLICLVTGMMTATFGGVTRDVLTGRPPRILHSEADAYALPAVGGAAAYMFARSIGTSQLARNLLGVTVGTALRVTSWSYDVRLPTGKTDTSYTVTKTN